MSAVVSACPCRKDSHPLHHLFELQLPEDFVYKVCSYEDLPDDCFSAVFRVSVKTEEEFVSWFEKFQSCTKQTFRIESTFPALKTEESRNNKRCPNLYRTRWRCHHKTRPRSLTADSKSTSKNTGCPASVGITLKKPIRDKKPKKGSKQQPWVTATKGNSHLGDGLLGVVTLQFRHNHGLEAASALRKRDVTEATRSRLAEFFRLGFSVEQAMGELVSDLEDQHGEEFQRIAADRAHCPDSGFCQRLRRAEQAKTDGEPAEVSVESLRSLVGDYGAKSGGWAELREVGGFPVVAVITPLMQRVSQLLPGAGEPLFVDSSSSSSGGGRLFLLLTDSPVGALPVGALITASELAGVLTAGLRLLVSRLDGRCFGGRGARGPLVAMSEDCTGLRMALQIAFPECRLLLCPFQMLRAAWRWLYGKESGVPVIHRQEALRYVRALLNAPTELELHQRWEELRAFAGTHKLSSFAAYAEERCWNRRWEWQFLFGTELSANDLTEGAFRTVKDKVLRRLREHTAAQLLELLTSRLESQYSGKLLKAAYGRGQDLARRRFYPEETNIVCMLQMGPTTYQVTSGAHSGSCHIVDAELELCTCAAGVTGWPCKHQAAVLRQNPGAVDAWLNFPQTHSEEARQLFLRVAIGQSVQM